MTRNLDSGMITGIFSGVIALILMGSFHLGRYVEHQEMIGEMDSSLEQKSKESYVISNEPECSYSDSLSENSKAMMDTLHLDNP